MSYLYSFLLYRFLSRGNTWWNMQLWYDAIFNRKGKIPKGLIHDTDLHAGVKYRAFYYNKREVFTFDGRALNRKYHEIIP